MIASYITTSQRVHAWQVKFFKALQHIIVQENWIINGLCEGLVPIHHHAPKPMLTDHH